MTKRIVVADHKRVTERGGSYPMVFNESLHDFNIDIFTFGANHV